MTNFEWIKSYSKDQMAAFTNLYIPSCKDWCKDAKEGCLWDL